MGATDKQLIVIIRITFVIISKISTGYHANYIGYWWELLYEIFDIIDVSVDNRIM